jgi:CubicO group peptidase (beta-lactamase class C family)
MLRPFFRLLLPVLFAALSAFGQSPSDQTTSRVDQIFARFERKDSPGCALAVIKDGQIVYKRGYGMANLDHDIAIGPETVFHVASVSKQFTAMAIYLLAAEGKLSLDDDVHKYIPELAGIKSPIKIRQLLTHTSGLRDQWSLLILSGWRLSEDVVKEKDVVDLLARMKELNFPPGDQHSYSNTGYTVAALIVKRVSGQTLREYTEEKIFKPLGMTRTFFRDDHTVTVKNQAYAYQGGPNGTFKLSVPNYDTIGPSSLLTTVEDLARWDANFYDYRIGRRATIEAMQVPPKLNNGDGINYAAGLIVNKYRGLSIVEHSGGDAGYRAHLIRFPTERFSIACLCNLGTAAPGQFARQVADIYLADRLTPAPPKYPTPPAAVPMTAAEAAAKAGAYWNEATQEFGRLRALDFNLHLSMPGYDNPIIPLTKQRFLLSDQPGEVEFVNDANGKPSHFLIRFGGRQPQRYDAMLPAELKTERLPEYVGDYESDEVGMTFSVAQRDGKLYLERRKFEPIVLEPIFRDGFRSFGIAGIIRFRRDANSRIIEMISSGGRVRGLRFKRQARP